MPASHHAAPEWAAPRGLAVLLPGSGSDEVFVRSALEAPLRAIGLAVHAPPIRPGRRLVDEYLCALDQGPRLAAELDVPLLVGGVSLGAQVAARWAARRSARVALGGLLLALPAWTGAPDGAPAAVAAAATAQEVRRRGLATTIADTRRRTPRWLGDELARAWRHHGTELVDSLVAASATPGPTEVELAGVAAPTGLVALRDDPVHPLVVAERWRELLPRCALVTTTLGALGRDRASLGRALALAWLRTSRAHTAGAAGSGTAGSGRAGSGRAGSGTAGSGTAG